MRKIIFGKRMYGYYIILNDEHALESLDSDEAKKNLIKLSKKRNVEIFIDKKLAENYKNSCEEILKAIQIEVKYIEDINTPKKSINPQDETSLLNTERNTHIEENTLNKPNTASEVYECNTIKEINEDYNESDEDYDESDEDYDENDEDYNENDIEANDPFKSIVFLILSIFVIAGSILLLITRPLKKYKYLDNGITAIEVRNIIKSQDNASNDTPCNYDGYGYQVNDLAIELNKYIKENNLLPYDVIYTGYKGNTNLFKVMFSFKDMFNTDLKFEKKTEIVERNASELKIIVAEGSEYRGRYKISYYLYDKVNKCLYNIDAHESTNMLNELSDDYTYTIYFQKDNTEIKQNSGKDYVFYKKASISRKKLPAT